MNNIIELDGKHIGMVKDIIKAYREEISHQALNYGSLEYEELRVCSECDKSMENGYVIENGLEYYCSDECLHKHYPDDEYNKMYDNGNGDSYWTSWEV